MTTTSPQAFLMSATLHGVVVALLFLFAYVLRVPPPDTAKVFELVAGEGDNFMAREPPAVVPAPKPVQPAPEAVKPTPTLAPKAPDPAVPNFKKKLVRDIIKSES